MILVLLFISPLISHIEDVMGWEWDYNIYLERILFVYLCLLYNYDN